MKQTYGSGTIRRILAAALAVVFVITAMPAVHAEPAAQAGSAAVLVGRYTFDGDEEGATAKNVVEEVVDGKLENATLSGSDLKIEEDTDRARSGKVLHFNNDNTAMMTITDGIDASKSFSLAMWVKETNVIKLRNQGRIRGVSEIFKWQSEMKLRNRAGNAGGDGSA